MARKWRLASSLCAGICLLTGVAGQSTQGPVQFYNTSNTLLPVGL